MINRIKLIQNLNKKRAAKKQLKKFFDLKKFISWSCVYRDDFFSCVYA